MGCDCFKNKNKQNISIKEPLISKEKNCKCVGSCYCNYIPILNNKTNSSMIDINNFRILYQISEGSYGKVYLCKLKENSKYFAIKAMKKSNIKTLKRVYVERLIMEKIKSPFISNIKYAFQDIEKLYLVTDFAQGGDLFSHINKDKYFSEERAKFYLCEVILAIEALHQAGIIYRDLKPENILLFSDGHLKLTDFGLSRDIPSEEIEDKMSVCGSKEYISPELKTGIYGKEIDWWALGILFYQMLTGVLPKINMENYETNKEKLTKPYQMSDEAYNFIIKLLNPNPKERLGFGNEDSALLKKDVYLKRVNFDLLLQKKIKPPFIPFFKNEEDLKYFDMTTKSTSFDRKLFDETNITTNQESSFHAENYYFERTE